MKPYDKYKDSGIEWIGEIPEHWEVKKLNYCFNQIGSGTTPLAGKTEYYENGEYNWLQTGDLTDCEIVKTSKKITKKALDEYTTLKFYPIESIVIAMYGATIGKIGILKFESTTNQACCVLAKPKDVYSKYVFYWLSSIKEHIISLSYGGGQPNISQELVRNLRIQIPSLQEQTTIATYLDRKTAEIDLIIANKQKLIALYEEEKQAVINQAVTQGLNPNAIMKDSGVEWLGEIPEHWEVKKLKHCLNSIVGGGTPSTANPLYWDGDIPWVSAKDMKQDYISRSEDCITELGVKESSTTYFLDQRIVIVVRSGILKHTFPVAINIVPIAINQDLKALKPILTITNEFLLWKLKGVSNEILTYCNKMGATVDSIDMQFFLNFPISFPEIPEQLIIISHIQNELKRINDIISKFHEQIALLQEYRTTLISEVVTGKVKVVE